MEKKKINGEQFEYSMSEEYANLILGKRKREKSKLDPQPYLCQYVNDQFGLKGTCVYVYY